MQQKLEARAFLLCLVLVSLAFIFLLQPFFGPIFWACAISVIFYPLHLRILRRYQNHPNLSALLTLCVCILVVILPVIFLISAVVSEGADFYQKFESGELDPAKYVAQVRTAFPTLQSTLDRFGMDITRIKEGSINIAMSGGKQVAQHALSIGQNTFRLIINICLMLYLTFFLLRDGNYLQNLIIRALPLGDARERLLFDKLTEVTRATIKGNLIVALVQGSLGGLIFWVLGIPGALLWGVCMAVASLIPAIGPALIWAPVAVYLFAIGENMNAAILIAFGVGIIGVVDNILRPILVGRDTKLPDYIVLLSTLGGLGMFGINGFVIGPLLAALFLAFWGIFMREGHLLVARQTDT